MAATHRNRLRCAVSAVASAGLGAFTVSAAVSTYRGFVAGDDALTFDLVITEGTAWEVRRDATYTHAGTSLARGTFEDSSTGSAIAFTAAAVLTVTLTAARMQTVQDGVSPTALPTIAAADVAVDDLFLVHDISAAATKSITRAELGTLFGGGLSSVTGTDANTSMAVNSIYGVSASALTASRTYTLPATAAVGDRVGIALSSSNTTNRIIVTAASGDTLNGTAGGTEHTSLFNAGDFIMLRCVTANAAWIVENFETVNSTVYIRTDGTTQTLARNGGTQLTTALTTVDSDASGEWNTSNKRYYPRRPGIYAIGAAVQMDDIQAGSGVQAYVTKGGTTVLAGAYGLVPSQADPVCPVVGQVRVGVGEYLDFRVYYEDPSTDRSTSPATNNNYFSAVRVGD